MSARVSSLGMQRACNEHEHTSLNANTAAKLTTAATTYTATGGGITTCPSEQIQWFRAQHPSAKCDQWMVKNMSDNAAYQ